MRPLRKAYVLPAVGLLLLGMMTGVVALTLVSAGEIYDYQDSVDGVHLPNVDAIVCLAGGRGRIAQAGDLWYRYWELAHAPLKGAGVSPVPKKPPILYISGMGHQSTWAVLGVQVRRGVLEAMKPEHVVLENESENTDENAQWLAAYAKERNWESILLVTSRYHMKRSRFMFERVLADAKVTVRIETLSVYQEPFEPGEWRDSLHGARVTVIEYLKWIYYRAFWKPHLQQRSTAATS